MPKKKKPAKPSSISVGGEIYQVVIMQIHTRDKQGRPKEVSIVYPEESVTLGGGEEFLTAFIPSIMAKKGN